MNKSVERYRREISEAKAIMHTMAESIKSEHDVMHPVSEACKVAIRFLLQVEHSIDDIEDTVSRCQPVQAVEALRAGFGAALQARDSRWIAAHQPFISVM